ncbi:SMC5-SMC6 complex localization factor 2 isoform X3 [Pelobates cultripes]|uniref:SMC5-SMC6 complex localization factor 2 isoform X3 n=1 Tax=Pelobates cultripes TaxID=61616 RepID=A0AAD1TB97_PELCU|nr:SMC5-SMC6 complex localization factor 2 isoform X3 [Pelobates cultripes]
MTSRGTANRFLQSVLRNGLGRYVGQLKRLSITFSKDAQTARGAREFIEEKAVDFAKQNPGVVLYVSPKQCRVPKLVAEYYLSGWLMESVVQLNALNPRDQDRGSPPAIVFLGFCTTIHPESFDDQEMLLLLVMLLKMYLEKRLRHTSVVDLHSLVKNLLRGIKDWDVKMPELCTAISQLSNHHHNYVKLVQLVPASDLRGRQLRRHLGLMCISKLLDQDYTSIPTNYDSQMIFLCSCLEKMKPSTLIKKMQSNPESDCTSDLEQEAYYLTFSLLNLTNDASSSDEHYSKQRSNYLLKLCIALEKHIKCDIRENARLFYRTKVKDLVARIYGKWQELLQSTRPDQVT